MAVHITDEYGCTQSATVFILVQQTSAIYIPNVFAPDGSDNNRLFRIYAGAAARVTSVLSFRVYDRWGSLVHERLDFDPDDPLHGWDGTLPGGRAATPGVFIWYVEFAFANGRKKLLKGDVTLYK
ncbi:MAG: gliding motility-associated C-terminal domain-containing protein [Saprospirales bacterium]|nr:gliding motility-associated C-terminal domain-containing protein [Saprospirales bacterium]